MHLTITVCVRSELGQVVAAFRATRLVVLTDPEEDEDIADRTRTPSEEIPLQRLCQDSQPPR